MGLLDRWSAKKRRENEVLNTLAGIASAEAATEEFRTASAFIRAYGVALGASVPEHTTRVLFVADVPYLRDAWRTDSAKVSDLASYLSWSQAKAAFNDVDHLAESVDEAKQMRSMLMTVTGRVFPASERAMSIMHDFDETLDSQDRQRALMATGAFLSLEQPLTGLHFRAVTQAIGKPWSMNEVDAAAIYEAARFLALLQVDATSYFNRRALEIFKAHVEHGVRPI